MNNNKKPIKKSQLEGYLTADEAAEALGLNPATLANWRAKRLGPPRIKIGKNTFYRLAALEAWIISRETNYELKTPKKKKHTAARKKK